MRSMKPWIVPLLLAYLHSLTACEPAPAARADRTAGGASAATASEEALAVRRTVDSINTALERWYAASQADSVASVQAEDVWLMGPAMPPVVGRDSVRAHWRRAMAGGVWRFTLRAQDVAVQGPIAIERGRYTLDFVPRPNAPAGVPPAFRDRGNYVVHWVQEDGQWRIKWDIAASELPMPAVPPKSDASAR